MEGPAAVKLPQGENAGPERARIRKGCGIRKKQRISRKKINRLNSQRGLHRMRCGITFVARQLSGHCGRTGLPGERKEGKRRDVIRRLG